MFEVALSSLWSRRGSVLLTVASLSISMVIVIGVEHIRAQAESSFVRTISNVDLLLDEAKKILEKHPKEVQDYKNGKDKLMGFFVGQIMKEMKGKANPKVLNEILNKLLEE